MNMNTNTPEVDFVIVGVSAFDNYSIEVKPVSARSKADYDSAMISLNIDPKMLNAFIESKKVQGFVF